MSVRDEIQAALRRRDEHNAAVDQLRAQAGFVAAPGDSIKDIFAKERAAKEAGLAYDRPRGGSFVSHFIGTVAPIGIGAGLAAAGGLAGLAKLAGVPAQLAQLTPLVAARAGLRLPGGGASRPPPPPSTSLVPGGRMFDDDSWGGTAMNLAQLALNYRTQRAAASAITAPTALPGAPAMITAAAFPALPALGTLGRAGMQMLTGAGAVVAAGAGLLRSAAGRIVGFMVGGRRISRKQGVALAKKVGLEAGAAALGVSAVELAQAVLEEEASGGGRRGRGVTAAQLRTTRRTMRVVSRMHSQIQGYARSAGVCRTRNSNPFRRRRRR